MELRATASQTSGSSDVDVFDIEFTAGCNTAELEAPIFSETDIVLSLYEPSVIDFTQSTSSKPVCGPITYKVIDVATGLPIEIYEATVDGQAGTLTLLETNK